jgi:transcriptional regulator of acetoin/glycerol metabolism
VGWAIGITWQCYNGDIRKERRCGSAWVLGHSAYLGDAHNVMRDGSGKVLDSMAGEARQRSLYRRLAASRLPVNLYSARAHMQRTAAALLHGMRQESGSWEELDGRQLADDVRGDRTALLLAGATGGVAHTSPGSRGLLAAAGAGTLFLTHIEKLSPAAQRVLASIIETGRYTPVGDPYPRSISCHFIVATHQPLIRLAHNLAGKWNLADALGRIALSAEEVIRVFEAKDFYDSHPSTFAAAS